MSPHREKRVLYLTPVRLLQASVGFLQICYLNRDHNSNWSDKNDIGGQLVDSSGIETSDPWCRWRMAHRPKPRKYSSQIGHPGHCAGGDTTKQLRSSTPRVSI